MVISQPKKILNKKPTWPLERFFQALQNLTKREFLALIVKKLRPYKGNPHGRGFGLKEGTKLELQRFSKGLKGPNQGSIGLIQGSDGPIEG